MRPQLLRAAAQALYVWREARVPVADLAFDSLLALPQPSLAPSTRSLCFARGRRAIYVSVARHATGVGLTVDVVPEARVRIYLRRLDGSETSLETDAQGHLSEVEVGAGLVGLLVRWPSPRGALVRTAWVSI